ncbi:hypothetical protein BC941DRAFT_457063 [Chlamydoabsidia padenii]|nr:hypothetical protein BC941DRAFT_457063 [Chlamydoabsidia padenii]
MTTYVQKEIASVQQRRIGIVDYSSFGECPATLTMFVCNTYGQPKKVANFNRHHDPISCGCSSKIIISTTEIYPTNITIKYFWEHSGHSPGSIQDMSSGPISAHARRAVENLVNDNNYDWKHIEQYLRADRLTLTTMLEMGGSAIFDETMRKKQASQMHTVLSSES